MLRRTLLQAAAATLATPAIAQRTPVLRFVPQANLTSLDPIWTTATVTSNHANYVYDTLYSTNAQSVPQPQMAEGHEVSADGLTWRFRLRPGLMFHDGTPVRAVDCGASIARWSKRDAFGQIIDKVVDKYEAADDRTLLIRLNRPFPLLLNAIAKPDSNVAWIMPERIASSDPNKAITEVLGSGPYRFLADEYVSGSRAAYAKFDGYVPRSEAPEWATGGKIAHYPRVEWHIIPDPATVAAALRNNEVDWWEQPLPDLLPSLERAGIRTQIDQPNGRLAIMRLNHLQAPFNDPRIRRAVLMSINQEDYMRSTVGDDRRLWNPCRSLYACGTPYARDYGAEVMRGDRAAAKRMLTEAGYANQPVVIINPTDFAAIGPLGQVSAEALKAIGMNVDLRESDWGTVIQRRNSREAVDKGGWSIFHTFGSAPAYASPAVSTLLRSQGASAWYGWPNDPAIEAMVQDWLDAPDAAAQAKVADAIGIAALANVSTIPLGQFFVKTAFRRHITGVLQGVAPYPWNVRPA